jgi:hypothetical protein
MQEIRFGCTNIDVDGKERQHCLLCMTFLTADGMKPMNKEAPSNSALLIVLKKTLFLP